MSDFDTLQAENFSQRDRFKRVSQREILPQAIKTRNLGEVILMTDVGTITAVVSTGQQVVLTNTIISTVGARLLSMFEVSIYIGSVASTNLLPGGSAIDHDDWQVILPAIDYASSDGLNVKNIVYVRNIAAGANQNVIFYTRSRAVADRQPGVPTLSE